uniref:URB1 ribosome biogenesis homolog n=1 Tax=Scleropages formosus TaxID=113540 RepID=A0A8C9VHG9_SCLFO
MLKEPTKASKGLERFVSVAKKLPCADLYDVVEGYITISMECADVFKLLEGEKHSENELMLIFQSLEMILLRTASDLSHFSMVGTTIVKKITSSYMKLLQSSLHSENHRFVRVCLCLLSSMVSQGADMAREVFSHFYFGKDLSGLARRRDKMGRPDVRMAYIQFALSFLISGDSSTISQVLDMKGIEICFTGLKEDRISVINLILSTLQTKVIWNKSISKTQKVRFFSPVVLAHFASLYKWNGIVDASSDEIENPEEDGKMVVRELVHKFLVDLCCSRKYGISFYDPSFGTAGRAGNIVLLQFLVGLKQATEDELVADLVVSVLKANPDMLSRYFKESQYSFAPRAKSVWQENITLLKKIYEAQPEVSKAFRTCEFVPLPRLLAMVMVTSLPPVCNKAFFTQGLSVDNTVVKHATLSLVSFILRRALKNIEHCLDQSVWRSSEFYTPAMMEDLVQLYREALSKILPDVNSIVWNWQSLMKKKAEDEVKKGKKEGGKEQSPTPHEHGSDEPEVILLKALILKVLCLYQKVVPHLISQSPFDFSKLLKGVVTDRGMTEQVPPVLQHQVLQLALELPASKFSWFRVQVKKATSETSVFYLLLKMFVSSDKSHLKNATRMLILKVLKDSSVFEYTWHELDLWLTHLDHIPSAQQETVVHFLERVLVRLMSNPYTYTDKAASLVQDAAHLQANPTGQEGDAASIPISHIDDVLDMVDVILDSSEGDMDQLAPSVSDDLILQTFPFSALVPAALEARNSLQATNKAEKGVVAQYLAAVLSDVLHCQRDPLPLCLALQHYDNELQSLQPTVALDPAVVDFHRYYSHWIPLQSKDELAFYNQGPTAWVQDSFRQRTEEALSTLQMTDFPVAIKQVLLYLKTSVDNFSTVSSLSGSSNYNCFPAFIAVALTVLRSIFTHPTLESWFLALELGTLPNHNLDPIRLKRMWSQLSKGTLALLQCSAPTLRELGSLELITGYLQAIQQAVLKELSQSQRKKGQQESWALKGLLALHEYMDVSCLREVASAMLLLPLERLVLDRAEGTELSVYGRAVLQVLSEGMSGCDRAPPLSQSQLRGLSSLLTSQPGGAAEDFLLQILQAEPACAVLLPADMFLHCLRGKSRSTAMAIGAIMLQNCPTHRLQFQLWCLEPSGLEEMASSVDYFLPLLNAYLGTTSLEDPAGAKGGQPQKPLKIFTPGCVASIGKSLTSCRYIAVYVLGQITDTIRPLCFHRWQLVDPIIDKLSESPEQLDLWRKAVLRAAFHWLNIAFRSNRPQESAFVEEEEAMLQRLQGLMVRYVLDWNGFVKCGLKYRYRSKIFLDTLNSLLRRIYDTTEVPKDLIALSTMHMMTTNHSLFLPSMLDPRDELAGNLSSKGKELKALVSLLLTLVQMCPSVCHVNHFLVLLGAYGATLCPTDQKLLLLLQEYERNDLSLADSQFLLWGPAAVEHHKARKSLGSSLWQQPSGEDLLALLNPGMMLNTMAHFPQQRRLTPQEDKELLYTDEGVQDLGTLYDPCFLLPLFSVMLKPESVVNCYKFVSSHALGVTVAALSSYDPKVRAAAYHVLGSFYHHLEAARFKEKRQLLYLMVTVRNGIRQENLRFPFLLTTYIGKVAQQMLRPEEHMYLVMNKFLLAHQYLDLKRVPGFFRLFFSSDTEHKTEREWILAMLKEGMMDRHCYKLCDQQGIFQVLMGFCTSPLCEESTQAQILEVLHQAAHNSKAAHELIKFHGLLSWILQAIERRCLDSRLLCGALDLVHRLWFTVLGQKNQPSKCSSVESTKCLPLPLISEFLCVLTAFIRHLQCYCIHVVFFASQFTVFCAVFSQTLFYRKYIFLCNNLFRSGVKSQHALKLLHFWGILSHNGPLLATLQGLLGRHKVKELLGKCRSLKYECGRKFVINGGQLEHPEEPAGEGDGEKHNGPILRDCEPLLRSIITHTETTPEGTDPESNALAFQTIQLLLKWTLRSLASGTGDVYSGLSPFLQWIQTSVLPYQVAVKAILADEAVKQDLLRLYHQTCKYQIPGRVPAQIETLQFFTTVMVHLLEAQGIPDGPLHKTVLNTLNGLSTWGSVWMFRSFPSAEAGLLLLSLYIQELWSGADEPVLFLTHVRLMDGVRQKGPKKQNAACAATAMCKAIAAAVGSVD